MDAQSKMSMGQIQQTVFLVQIVGFFLFLLFIYLFLQNTTFSMQHWDTRGFSHCSVLMFQSCVECAYVRTLVVRVDLTTLYFSGWFVIYHCYWLIWRHFLCFFVRSRRRNRIDTHGIPQGSGWLWFVGQQTLWPYNDSGISDWGWMPA